MSRAAARLLMMLTITLMLVGRAAAAPNTQGALLPAIISFSADAASVSYAAVEAGTAQVTLSWQTVNTGGQYRIAIDAYQGNSWVSVLGANEMLPMSGSKQITVALPQSFGVPTFHLTLKTSMGGIVGQQYLTIPYSPAAESAPSIDSFTTSAKSIDVNLLVQSNARLTVSWQISNRQPDTLIRFEQVFPDGSTLWIESPRATLWLPSQGQSTVLPRPTTSHDSLTLRMSLVNLHDGTVYDQKDLTLPIVGQVMQAPASVSQPQALTASRPTITGSQIDNFSAQSAPPSEVVLNWDAGDAQSVDLLESVANNGPTTLYIELPPSGSLQVPVPPQGVTYTLRVHGADGQTSTGEVNVTPQGGG